MTVASLDHMFDRHLREHFGERSGEFPEHIASLLRSLWDDSVLYGRGTRAVPDSYVFRRRLDTRFGEPTAIFSGCLLGLLRALWDSGVAFANAPCVRCGATDDVRMEESRTRYTSTGDGPDPNAPVPLCRPCAADHHEHWDEMWDEYRASVY